MSFKKKSLIKYIKGYFLKDCSVNKEKLLFTPMNFWILIFLLEASKGFSSYMEVSRHFSQPAFTGIMTKTVIKS